MLHLFLVMEPSIPQSNCIMTFNTTVALHVIYYPNPTVSHLVIVPTSKHFNHPARDLVVRLIDRINDKRVYTNAAVMMCHADEKYRQPHLTNYWLYVVTKTWVEKAAL